MGCSNAGPSCGCDGTNLRAIVNEVDDMREGLRKKKMIPHLKGCLLIFIKGHENDENW